MQVAKTLFGALIASCLALPAAAETVGRAAAVNPTSTGQPPGGTQRTLKLGSDVVHRERVVTTSSGSLQFFSSTARPSISDRTATSSSTTSSIGRAAAAWPPR